MNGVDTGTIFAVLSFGANIVLALIVYSFKATIRVAILEAVAAIQKTITSEYATKVELKDTELRLNERIDFRDDVMAAIGKMRKSD